MAASILNVLPLSITSCSGQRDKKPNVVILFLDDSGYSDFFPFGEPQVPTPHVQNLANEGVVYTNFYVPQAICSASRAALLSGCYPGRTGVVGAHGPNGRGLETNYPIMAEIFKSAGYKTGWFGKWHCGDQKETRPHARGFDETAGLMYSNDMWKYHPQNPEHWGKFPLQYWRNGKVTINDMDSIQQRSLTKWTTEFSVDFIERNKKSPFFLYVPYSMPHVPLFVSPEFQNKSGKGLYADVTMELDWSVGQITQALKKANIDKNTIVILTSDNGPWVVYGNHAGKTPYREAKATSFDGGIRSACIIKYPNGLEGGKKSNKTFFSIDLLPTLCHLASIDIKKLEIDGKNVWPLINSQKDLQFPHEYYAISTDKNLDAIMSGDGRWKLHLPHKYRTPTIIGNNGNPGKYRTDKIELSLFDMHDDPKETHNVVVQYPEIVKTLLSYADQHIAKFYTKKPD